MNPDIVRRAHELWEADQQKVKPANKKRKGEYSDFFKLLQKAKAEKNEGKRDTKKAVRKLMKQLSEEAGNATGTIATS